MGSKMVKNLIFSKTFSYWFAQSKQGLGRADQSSFRLVAEGQCFELDTTMIFFFLFLLLLLLFFFLIKFMNNIELRWID